MENKEIIENIKAYLDQGKSKEEIYKELLNQGWKVDIINEAFNKITSNPTEDNTKKGIRIVFIVIGCIFISAGILSIIITNWQEMSRLVRVFIIISSMTIAYLSGWYFKEESLHKKKVLV